MAFESGHSFLQPAHPRIQGGRPLVEKSNPIVQILKPFANQRFESIKTGRNLRLNIAELAPVRGREIVELRAKIPPIVLGMKLHVAQLGADRL